METTKSISFACHYWVYLSSTRKQRDSLFLTTSSIFLPYACVRDNSWRSADIGSLPIHSLLRMLLLIGPTWEYDIQEMDMRNWRRRCCFLASPIKSHAALWSKQIRLSRSELSPLDKLRTIEVYPVPVFKLSAKSDRALKRQAEAVNMYI